MDLEKKRRFGIHDMEKHSRVEKGSYKETAPPTPADAKSSSSSSRNNDFKSYKEAPSAVDDAKENFDSDDDLDAEFDRLTTNEEVVQLSEKFMQGFRM